MNVKQGDYGPDPAKMRLLDKQAFWAKGLTSYAKALQLSTEIEMSVEKLKAQRLSFGGVEHTPAHRPDTR